MNKMIPLFLILWLACLSPWGYAASPESYLPLQEGLTWEFRQTFFDLKTKEKTGEAKAIKKNLAPVELKGTKVSPQVFLFYQPANVLKQETKSFLDKDQDGFYVVARQSTNDKEPVIDKEKFYVLKFPLTKGATWKQYAEGLIMHNTIESTEATVQVPAGTFKNCLLIKKMYFQKNDPTKAIQESLLWFAPDVGNVKVVVKNTPNNREIVQELVSFRK